MSEFRQDPVAAGQQKAATTFGTYAQFDVMEIGQVLKVGSLTTPHALTQRTIIYNSTIQGTQTRRETVGLFTMRTSTLNKFQGYENGAWARAPTLSKGHL
jgi:hypothetical protein